jgi:hypothetical protein
VFRLRKRAQYSVKEPNENDHESSDKYEQAKEAKVNGNLEVGIVKVKAGFTEYVRDPPEILRA